MEMKPMLEIYHSLLSDSINEEGVYPHPAIIRDANGHTTMLSLDLTASEAMKVFITQIHKLGGVEAILAMDRYTKPGQGTKYNDLMAGWYYNAESALSYQDRLQTFIIEYQHEPRIVDPYVWDNPFWTPILKEQFFTAAKWATTHLFPEEQSKHETVH